MDLTKESIPHLNIEVLADGVIRLENESMGDSYVVDVHPMHLRLMAEKLGLVREATASDMPLLRDLGRYKRALLMLRDRAEQLYQNIFNLSQSGIEGLGVEVAQSVALADFASHICSEFEDDFTAERPNTPKSGALEDPHRGASPKDADLSAGQLDLISGDREGADDH